MVNFSSSNAFSIANLSEGAQQRFASSTIYRKSFELVDVSVPNKNEMCDASQLAANEHICLNKSNTSVFQLKQELVNFSTSDSFSIAAKLDSCNKTTFQDFVSTSFANFQLIVDLFLIQNREGAREVSITHYSASE